MIRRRTLWLLTLVAALVVLDLWSKTAVFAYFDGDPDTLVRDAHGHRRLLLLGERLAFMQHVNYGSAWGAFEDWPRALVGFRCVVSVVLLVLLFRETGGRLNALGLALVLAGALGNLYDNLVAPIAPRHDKPFGPVRDFIDVYFPEWDWHFETFNVADACISIGVLALLVASFLPGARTGSPEPPAPDPDVPARATG